MTQDQAILVAVRERLDGTSTETFRRVAADTLAPELWQGLPDAEASRRALGLPIFSATIDGHLDYPDLSELSAQRLYTLRLKVDTVYFFGPSEELDEEARSDVYALASYNAKLLRAALCAPAQLETTNDGDETGLCSGCMAREVASDMQDVDATSGTLRWSQTFEAIAIEILATS